jgi:hypothetical protein
MINSSARIVRERAAFQVILAMTVFQLLEK